MNWNVSPKRGTELSIRYKASLSWVTKFTKRNNIISRCISYCASCNFYSDKKNIYKLDNCLVCDVKRIRRVQSLIAMSDFLKPTEANFIRRCSLDVHLHEKARIQFMPDSVHLLQ